MTIPEPGRVCPLDYRYDIESFARHAEVEADALYVAGGLYGNTFALDAIECLARSEGAELVFNGDFHWFDRNEAIFAEVNRRVLSHHALRGNVETELSRIGDIGAGCGCAYPPEVDQQTVDRSNAILRELQRAAAARDGQDAALAALPMTLVANVGGVRIGIVHGDCESLAGWRFSAATLDLPRAGEWLEQVRHRSKVDVFASSHTCLPLMRRFAFDGGPLIVANNGAAGMPNFTGTSYGIVTRIATRPWRGRPLNRAVLAGVYVEAIPLLFDDDHWRAQFLSQWPEGSDAWRSYWARITLGPAYEADTAYRMRQ